MATSPLDPSNMSGRSNDRSLGRGHGTRALGPSDSSDSGSDLVGAPGLGNQVDGFGIDRNTNETEDSFANYTAGPDVGDANLDGDSDRTGTGETAAAARDVVKGDGADIDADHIEALPEGLEELDEAGLRNTEDLSRDEEDDER